MESVARGLLGMCALLFFAWLISYDRRRFPWKIVIAGLSLQWVLALVVLETHVGRNIFRALATVVTTILKGADAGAEFVFGPLVNHDWPAIVGIKILTTIIIVAILSSVGYHYGILQRAVGMMAWVMKRAMGVSGAESLAAAANVFFGQTEAPLLIKPYISRMTRSELMALMTVGFATVAAGVLAVYVNMLGGDDEAKKIEVARHLLTACLMSAPAAFVMAKIISPETETPETSGAAKVALERETSSLLDAITAGASQGMKLAINVLAMLIGFIALIAVVDFVLNFIGETRFVAPLVGRLGLETLDLKGLLGILFWPVAWLIGIAPDDCRAVATLIGQAMATNEIIAYEQLGQAMAAMQPGSEATAITLQHNRSALIAMYGICGFANFSSIGIQIAGIGGLAPDRRGDLVKLGFRAMLGGAMGCWMTGSIAGILLA